MRCFGLTVVAAAILLLAGCGDDVSEPPRGAGVYRLASMNGMRVPVYFPPSIGLAPLLSGDLHLRADGTFGLGFQSGGFFEGSWQLDGADLRLTDPRRATIDGRLEGDSVTLTLIGFNEQEFVYVFERDRSRGAKPTRVSGTHVVTALMGSPDLTYEFTSSDGRSTTVRIVYDSLTILDGVFFRHAREVVVGRSWGPSDPPLNSSYTLAVHGAYDVDGEVLALRHYISAPFVPAVDSVWILTNRLERRQPDGLARPDEPLDWRETYTRVR